MQLHLRTFVGSAVLFWLAGSGPVAYAQVGALRPDADSRFARVASGTIEGEVLDEAGGALSGATVTALGSASVAAVTDARGRFALRLLPAGAYVIRTHLAGFLPSRRQMVDVRPNGYARYNVSLRRAALTSASVAVGPGDGPVVVTALDTRGSRAVPGSDASASGSPATDDHSETAWRLRHLTRNVLKESTGSVIGGDWAQPPAGDLAIIGPAVSDRRLASAARDAVSNLFTGLPLAGEVNFLTTGALDRPRSLLVPQGFAGGVTYLSLHGPAFDHGDWSAKLIIAPAGVASYYVSGSYRTRAPGATSSTRVRPTACCGTRTIRPRPRRRPSGPDRRDRSTASIDGRCHAMSPWRTAASSRATTTCLASACSARARA